MGWYAIEGISEAAEKTREVLFPFDIGIWARLFIIVVLAGYALNPSMPLPSEDLDLNAELSGDSYSEFYGTSLSVDAETFKATDVSFSGISAGATGFEIGLTIFLFIVAFGYLLINHVFRFIYYRSLQDEEIIILDNFKGQFFNGLRYFLFRISIYFLFTLLILAALLGFYFHLALGIIGTLFALLTLVPILVFLVLTFNFILLRMMDENLGVIPAWIDFWQDLRREWEEVLVYIGVRLILRSILFAIGGLLYLFVIIILIILFGIPAFLLYLVSPVLAVFPLTIGLILLLGYRAVYQVIARTFLYNYAIIVYDELTM